MVEALYTLHREPLRRYCAALCTSDATAEDLLQEVFVRALCHEDALAPLDEKQRRAWLYKTARNLFFDHVRHSAMARDKQAMLAGAGREETGLETLEAGLLLACLPYDLRVLMQQRYLEGYRATELAELYGLPPSTIRGKLRQARLLLQQALREKP